ncbi:hypothetical protein FRB95_010143 [Tulasnella sp. JGI-2019a]|nr:hypothetical protein FRB95_010143 [Tulasnella sp. JGI-2019a]
MRRFDKALWIRQLLLTVRLMLAAVNLVIGGLALASVVYLVRADDGLVSDIVWLTIACACVGISLATIELPKGWGLRGLFHVAYPMSSWMLCFHVREASLPAGFDVTRIEVMLIGLAIALHLTLVTLAPELKLVSATNEVGGEGQRQELALEPPDTAINLEDIRDYKIIGVGWWRELDMFEHDFLLVKAAAEHSDGMDTTSLRIERYETSWAHTLRGHATYDSTISGDEEALTRNATLVAALDVSPGNTHTSGWDLHLVNQLLQAAHHERLWYIVPPLSCWLFATCTFGRIASIIAPNTGLASCYQMCPKRLPPSRRKNLAAYRYDIPPSQLTLETGIVRRMSVNEVELFCRHRMAVSAWNLGLRWIWPRVVIFTFVVGGTMVVCGYGRVLAVLVLIGLVLWIAAGWFNSVSLATILARVHSRADDEGEARTVSRLRSRGWPTMFDLIITAILLTAASIATAVVIKENSEALLVITFMILIVGSNISIQVGWVVYLSSRSVWALICQTSSELFIGMEHPHHYLRHGGDDIPGIPRDFKLADVSWWQQSNTWHHQFLVVHAESARAPESVFVRLERDKSDWFHWRRGNTGSTVRLSSTLEGLTQEAHRIASFTVVQPQYDCDLPLLGRLVQVVNEESPIYFLPTLNCYWFAFTCFERLGSRLGWRNVTCRADMTLTGARRVRAMSGHEMLKFCFQRTVAQAMLLSHSAIAATLLMAPPTIAGIACSVKLIFDEELGQLLWLFWVPIFFNMWFVVFWFFVLSAYWRVSRRFGDQLSFRSFGTFLRSYAITLLLPQLFFALGFVDAGVLASIFRDGL